MPVYKIYAIIIACFIICTAPAGARCLSGGTLREFIDAIIEGLIANPSNDTIKLQPKAISPKDDAYHGPYLIPSTEWWYFDAIFDNGYILHAGISIYSVDDSGLLRYTIEIYRGKELFVKSSALSIFLPFFASKEYPFITVGNRAVMELDLETLKNTGRWKYKLYLEIGTNAVNLTYIGTTNGWKYQTGREGWVVPLPKAMVYGNLIVNGVTVTVKGTGYHDHNWNYTLLTGIDNEGWYWGRISGKRLSLTWAEIRSRQGNNTRIATLNVDLNSYIGMDQENISITVLNFTYINGQNVPSKIKIVIDCSQVKADVVLEVVAYHPSTFLTLRYCRLFVKAYGYLSVGSYREDFLGSLQIAESMSFL